MLSAVVPQEEVTPGGERAHPLAVVSSGPELHMDHASADWGETTISAGDLAAAITRLKQERSDGYLLAHVLAAHP